MKPVKWQRRMKRCLAVLERICPREEGMAQQGVSVKYFIMFVYLKTVKRKLNIMKT
jgi:hypothetical protein